MTPAYKALLFGILRRLLPAGLLLAIGTGILLAAGDILLMLVGYLLYLAAAILLAGPLARLLAEPLGDLYWPRRYFDQPQPMYGIPESRRRKGQFEEALAEYEKIAAAHPAEVRPWLDMIDIALTDLRDPERANTLFQRGLAALADPDAKDHLARVYAATRDRRPPAPARKLELPGPLPKESP